MRDITDKFTTHLKNVLTRALVFVVERGRQTVKPEHLLWALGTQKGCIGGELLGRVSVSTERLRGLVGATGKESDAVTDEAIALRLSDPAKRILEKAVLTANVYNHRYIGTEHLLSAMLQVNDATIDGFFEEEKTDLKELRRQTAVVLKSATSFPELTDAVPEASTVPAVVEEKSEEAESSKKKTPALDFFGRELTSPDIQANIDPVIGREMEIQRVMEILCRRTKNNPLLLGDPGVGKTAIVEGLAKRILEGNVPHPLRDKRVVALDMATVVAGTMYRGEFEARLRQLIDEVKAHPDVILFIDEIHTIVGAGAASGSMDAANILKPALARGEIRCIGATTHAEYKKHFESDAALERRFGNVAVDEPSPERTLEILRGIVPNYETFHGVRMTPAAVEAAVRLSVRHVHDKRLPDKAIDLIDEAAASARVLAAEPGPAETLRLLRHRLEELRERKRSAVVEERFDDAKTLKDEEERLRADLAATEPSSAPHSLLIDEKDIARVVSRVTGVPLQELIEEERSALGRLEEELRGRVFGQDRAVAAVAAALRRAKTGMSHPNRPLASFLFLGPSGVGKTELAKAVSISAFGDAKSLIRLDMSEFSEPFTASKLVGSPAGYVGYREGAKLTDAVKARPYSVVLFDEIEKAHKDIQNLLLQILEEGELTDATGRKVSFRHAVVVMTSNVGLERFNRSSMGFASGEAEAKTMLDADLKAELNERFRPELVNRLDHVCVFEPLTRDVLASIARRALTEVALRLQERGIGFEAGQDVADYLASQADPKIGARDIRRRVQTDVEAKIADRLIEGRLPKRLTVSRKGTGLVVKETRATR